MNSNGFLLVDKPKGWTSFDVCGRLRKLIANSQQIKPKQVKVGHTGTLDPFATGLLVVALGKATKLIPFFEKDRKQYEAEVVLGARTETGDGTGEIVSSIDNRPAYAKATAGKQQTIDKKELEAVLEEHFTGKIEQVPPKYSAIKIGGKRAYDLARKGEEVEMKPRATEVFEIKVLEYEYPKVKLYLDVAAGFYVRALARDLGEMVGGGGYCGELRRVGIGGRADSANEKLKMKNEKWWIKEEDLEAGCLEEIIDPVELLPQVEVMEMEEERWGDFREGRVVPVSEGARQEPRGQGRSHGDHGNERNEKYRFVRMGGQTVGLGEVVYDKIQPRILLV